MTGNKNIDTLLILLMLLATGGTVGTFVYSDMIFKRPLPEDSIEFDKLVKESKKTTYPEAYKLDKLIINLISRQTRLRFLDVQAYLVPFKNHYVENFETNKAFIQDSFIDIASRIPPGELNSITGKILLETRLKKRINKFFNRPVVKKIFFSKFVVQ